MRTLFTQFFATFVVAVAVSLSLGTVSHAANSQMALSPTKQRIDIATGETYSNKFTIHNGSKDELKFKVYAAPYTVQSNTEYTPVFSQDKPRTQISRWVTFDQTEYIVAPGEKAEVPYHVVVPASIPDGSQYAALFAETIEEGTGSVVAHKRVGMLLYAKPKDGHTTDKGNTEFSSVGMWQMTGNVITTTKINNTGNTDFEASVKLRVTSAFGGKEVKSEEVTRTILPDSTRTIELKWPNTPPIGLYKVAQSATFLGNTTSQEKTIIVMSPVILIIIIGIIIALVAWGVRRVTRKKPSLGR